MSELILLPMHPKTGAAALVEQATQDILDNTMPPDERIAQFEDDIQGLIKGDTVSADYARAKRVKQVVFSAAAFEIGKAALPALRQELAVTGQLAGPADFDLETYVQKSSITDHSAVHLQVLQAGCHQLMVQGEAVLGSMRQGDHPASALYPHLDRTHFEQQRTLAAWKAGPGRNRWPHYNNTLRINGPNTLLGTLCVNVDLGLNLLSARAIHHLIHTDSEASTQILDEIVAQEVPHIRWLSSTGRHLGWRPDWEEAQARGEHVGVMPHDGVEALLQQPTSKIVEENSFAASKNGMAPMQDPNFCPHAAIAEDPLPNAAACSGDVQVRYPESRDRVASNGFFAEAGFIAENSHLSFTSIALVVARTLLRDYLLPTYAAHRSNN